MPTYIWTNIHTGEEVEIECPISESDLPPDDSGQWKKLIRSTSVVRGPSWGTKGNLK